MNEDKDLVKITLLYDDGSSREVDKGFICSMSPSEEYDGSVEFIFNMCNVSGAELKTIIMGMVQLGERMGMFDDSESEGDE